MKRFLAILFVMALAVSANANLLINGDFEAPANPFDPVPSWTAFTLFGGNWQYFNANPFGLPVAPTSGVGMAAALSGWDTSRNEAGILQQFFNPGGDTTISFMGRAYGKFFDNPVNPYDVGVQLGFDPTGGTDPFAATVDWQDPVWATGVWESRSKTYAGVPAGINTVFVKSIHKWGIEWNLSAADDVSATVVPEPASLLALASGLTGLAALKLRRK